MASFTGVLTVIVAVFSMAAAEKTSSPPEQHGKVSEHTRRKHHVRFSHLKQFGREVSHNVHVGPDDEKFGAIQTKLIGAWKEKAHLEHLESNLQSQKTLLDKEKQFLPDNSDDEERKQVFQMYQIVKESRALTDKVRTSALKKTQDAMAEVMGIDTSANEQMARNNQEIGDLRLKIAQDVAANAEANRTKQRAKTVLAAALQEAKYFQTVLSQAKTEKQDSLNEEKSMMELAYKLKEKNQEDEAGVEKDETQWAAKETDQDSDRDDHDKHDKAARDSKVLAAMKNINADAN